MKQVLLSILTAKLKFLAKLTLLRYQPDVVGVTGSVGKTSTKEAIRAVLARHRSVRSSSKSYNNDIGLPLTILGDWKSTEGLLFWPKVILVSLWRICVRMKNPPELIVLEYGVDRPGDMKRLLSVARPTIGVFTAMGITPVHVEHFSSPEAIVREKTKLIAQLPSTGFAILNADDPLIMEVKTQTRAQVMTFGFSEGADVRISSFANHADERWRGVSFKLTYAGSFVPIRIEGVFGKSQAYAAAAAAAVGLVSGVHLVDIAEGFAQYHAPVGRLNAISGVKETLIIDDTYNASPIAMQEGLETLKSLKPKRAIAVLGDMLELGKYTLEEHARVGKIAAKCADVLITVGIRGKFIAEAAVKAGMSKRSVYAFMNVVEAGVFLQNKLQRGDVIYIKGSQSVRMEKVTKEVMAEPQRAGELLVRQSKVWEKTVGLYDL